MGEMGAWRLLGGIAGSDRLTLYKLTSCTRRGVLGSGNGTHGVCSMFARLFGHQSCITLYDKNTSERRDMARKRTQKPGADEARTRYIQTRRLPGG